MGILLGKKTLKTINRPTYTIFQQPVTPIQQQQQFGLIAYEILFQQDDTKIVNFYEGVLILWSFFEAMSFSRCALLSQKSQFTYQKCFHCLASPGKVSALAL